MLERADISEAVNLSRRAPSPYSATGTWRSYDDYLAALDAKYRRNARDQMKKLAEAGCALEPLTDLATHGKRLHELYLAVHSHAPIRLVTLREGYFAALA